MYLLHFRLYSIVMKIQNCNKYNLDQIFSLLERQEIDRIHLSSKILLFIVSFLLDIGVDAGGLYLHLSI